jgi:hypothetical protein
MPTPKPPKFSRMFFLEAVRADDTVVERVDATGWTELQLRAKILTMLLTPAVDHVHEQVEWRLDPVP